MNEYENESLPIQGAGMGIGLILLIPIVLAVAWYSLLGAGAYYGVKALKGVTKEQEAKRKNVLKS